MDLRRLVPVLLALAIVGALVWMFADTAPVDPVEEPQDADTPAAGPKLATRARTRSAEPAAMRDGGRLVIRVLDRGAPIAATIQVARRALPTGPVDNDVFDASVAPRAVEAAPAWVFDRHVPSGTVEVPVEPGRYEIQVRADDDRAAMTRVTVGREGRSVDLDILRGPYSVTARAQYGDGAPFRGWILLAPRAAYEGSPWKAAWRGPVPCADDGSFTVSALPADAYAVWAVDPTLPFGSVRAALEVPSGLRVWRVDTLTRTITGRVEHAETSQPLPGVRVRLLDGYGGHYELAYDVVTDEDGAFALRAFAGQAVVEIHAAGFAPWRRIAAATTNHLVAVLHPSQGLRGRVTPDGDATAGLGGIPIHAGNLRAETDASGRYVFPVVPHDAYSLFALGQGWCSVGLEAASRKTAYRGFLRFPGQTQIDLPVVRTGTVRGTARWKGGAPVVGELVRAQPATYHLVSPLIAWQGQTDARGQFVLPDLVPGLAYRLVLETSQGAKADEPLRVASGETLQADLELAPIEQVLVSVLDEAGRPVRGARLVDWNEDVMAETSADGVAEVPAFTGDPDEEPDPWVVQAVGFPWSTFLVPRAGKGPVEVRLSRGLVTSGTVRMADGSAVPHATTAAVLGVYSQPVVLDEAGRFEVRLASGTHEIYAHCGGEGRWFTGSRLLEAGTRDNEITLSLDAQSSRARWTLTVEGPDARPPGLIHATTFEVSERGGGNIAFGRTFENGIVVLPGPSGATPLWIEVYDARGHDGAALGWAPHVVGPLGQEGGERTVRLTKGHVLRGRVESTDGVPLPGVRVRAVPTVGSTPQVGKSLDHVHASAYSDATGAFALEGLAQEVYRLDVAGPATHVRRDDVTNAAPGDMVLIRFLAAPDVAVTVFDEAGRPVRATVVVGPHGAGTDASGQAVLRGLDPDERYTLTVRASGLRAHVQPDWTPADTRVRLSRGLAIRGRLIDGQGVPYGHAELKLWRGEKFLRTNYTEPDGRFEFVMLEPGVYRIQAHDGERDLGAPVVAEAGADLGDLRVDAGPQIVVQIDGIDATQERPLAYLGREGAGDMLEQDIHEGRVRFPQLEADGRYTVWVLQGNRYVWLRDLKPGPERLHAALAPGGSIRGRLIGMTDHDRTYGLQVIIRSGGVRTSTETDTEGNFVLHGVPPGRWMLEAFSYAGSAVGTSELASPGDAGVLIDVTRPK